MANNVLPKPLERLTALAEDAADGAHQLEVIINLKQNKEADIRADLFALKTAVNAYDVLASARPAKTAAVDVARSNARAALVQGRDRLKPVLGSLPSAAWLVLGFTAGSLAVPSTSERLLPMLDAFISYFTAHAAEEVAVMGITAANYTALHTALSDTVAARNLHLDTMGAALAARDAAEAALRRRLRGLITELEQLLDPLSTHWLAFGLKRPGAPDSPDMVENTRATPNGPNALRVQCDAAARADYYQIYILIAGTDTDYRLVYSDSVPDKILESLPTGVVIKIHMRAVNETGPGEFGEEIEITLSAA